MSASAPSRPLQNRVAPTGEIVAAAARGTMMGNRGGRIHDPADKRLVRRRWASRAWICCVLSFKDRWREVMGPGYTHLFFLDEATACAAGHRPCYECRRADALAFADAWAEGHSLPRPPRAGEMDAVLHPQRLGPPDRIDAADLRPGMFFGDGDRIFLRRDDDVLPWDWTGYGAPVRPPSGEVSALTPAGMRRVLQAGWRPGLHPSAT
ncbi:MAG: hypothetical protein AAF676_18790 [Pseudomonadota bacterium]